MEITYILVFYAYASVRLVCACTRAAAVREAPQMPGLMLTIATRPYFGQARGLEMAVIRHLRLVVAVYSAQGFAM